MELNMALSPAFITGAAAYFPVEEITFDRFHEVKLLNEAMDKVRKCIVSPRCTRLLKNKRTALITY